ncbi:15806_t:CDS:1, partial [Acaulospora morrowiae]
IGSIGAIGAIGELFSGLGVLLLEVLFLFVSTCGKSLDNVFPKLVPELCPFSFLSRSFESMLLSGPDDARLLEVELPIVL